MDTMTPYVISRAAVCALALCATGLLAAQHPGPKSPAKGWHPMDFKKPSDAELRSTLTPLQYQEIGRAHV